MQSYTQTCTSNTNVKLAPDSIRQPYIREYEAGESGANFTSVRHNLPVCAPDLGDQMRSTTGSYIPRNTLGPEVIGRYLPDNILKCIFLKQNTIFLKYYFLKVALMFAPKPLINDR